MTVSHNTYTFIVQCLKFGGRISPDKPKPPIRPIQLLGRSLFSLIPLAGLSFPYPDLPTFPQDNPQVVENHIVLSLDTLEVVKPQIIIDKNLRQEELDRVEAEKQAKLEAERKAAQEARLRVNVTSGISYGGLVTVLDSGNPAYYNCVATVRLFRDYPQGGNPYATPQFINSKEPQIGAVAVQSNHVSLVVGINESTVTVKEGNFIRGKLTQREIPKSAIRGYWL